jgi:hypothetical protein
VSSSPILLPLALSLLGLIHITPTPLPHERLSRWSHKIGTSIARTILVASVRTHPYKGNITACALRGPLSGSDITTGKDGFLVDPNVMKLPRIVRGVPFPFSLLSLSLGGATGLCPMNPPSKAIKEVPPRRTLAMGLTWLGLECNGWGWGWG